MILKIQERLVTGEYLASDDKTWLKFECGEKLFLNHEHIIFDLESGKLTHREFPDIQINYICHFDSRDLAESFFK